MDSPTKSGFVEGMKTFLANQARPIPKIGDIVVIHIPFESAATYIQGVVLHVGQSTITMEAKEYYRVGIGMMEHTLPRTLSFTKLDITDFDPFDISLDD